MLNMTKVELKYISDADMYLFFEKGMREGVSYICEIYSKANKKYLKLYDPKQESNHILYLDAKNLYMLCLKFFQQAYSNGYTLKSLA